MNTGGWRGSYLPVSIPFKREGAFKDSTRHGRVRFQIIRFNSLQAGRGVQSVDVTVRGNLTVIVFQFPSSGKGRSKNRTLRYWKHTEPSFQFPSSGKGRSKASIKRIVNGQVTVSIPFKREGAFKGTSILLFCE